MWGTRLVSAAYMTSTTTNPKLPLHLSYGAATFAPLWKAASRRWCRYGLSHRTEPARLG
jgi:hypothetical protein